MMTGVSRRIALRVVENLLELLQAQLLSPFALQVEIVNHQRLAAVIELGDQRDAAAFASLQQRHAGDEQPARLPPSRLMFEPDHARRADRQRGEQRLAVIGRIFGGALAQFLKFGREDIVHAESFGEILGDILSVSAPRAQIDFLKDAQIGLDAGGSGL